MTTGAQRSHFRGKYVIRTEWRGRILLYEVATRDGLLVACGIDMLSRDERAAVESIAGRLFGKDRQRSAA